MLVVAVFLAIGLLAAVLRSRTAQAPPADSAATVDWGVVGVLLIGALVLLLKPRRRVAPSREKIED